MLISTRNTAIYTISQFLYALVFTIPIWIVYYQSRISISQISFLVAFQFGVQLLLELPTGAFADLLGRKTSIAIGYLLWVLFYVMVISTSSFSALVFATFLGGLAESLISGSLEALIYDSLKEDNREAQFAKINSMQGIIFQFGLAIAMLSGGYLYQISWALPYIFCAVATSIAFCFSLGFVEPKVDSVKFTVKNYLAQMKDGMIHAFATKKVALISMFYVVVAAITWTNNIYFFDYMLVELGFPDAQRGVIGGVIRIFNVLVLGSLLRNSHIFTRNRSIFFFPITMLVCFLPGIYLQGWWALPFVAGAVMAGTGRWIVLTKYTNEMFESRYRATAISTLSLLTGIVCVGITMVSGPIIERFGGVRMIYTLLGIATLVTVVPLAFAVTKDRQ